MPFKKIFGIIGGKFELGGLCIKSILISSIRRIIRKGFKPLCLEPSYSWECGKVYTALK